MFSKPIQKWTATDVETLINKKVRESPNLEFKQDSLEGSKPKERHYRDVAKELIAMANAFGGYLIYGIKESHGGAAETITPVLQCEAIVDQFADSMRDRIEPMIQGMTCRAIVTEEDGHSGILVFHVPKSLKAPHRDSNTKEAYRRVGKSSAPISMIEIQDMTLSLQRNIDEIAARFRLAREDFDESHKKYEAELRQEAGDQAAVSFQCTSVPLADFSISDVVTNIHYRPVISRSSCSINGQNCNLSVSDGSPNWRPNLRGLYQEISGGLDVFRKIDDRGSIIERMHGSARPSQNSEFHSVYAEWLLPRFVQTLLWADRVRCAAGQPDLPFGVSVLLQLGSAQWRFFVLNQRFGHSFASHPDTNGRLFVFPEYQLGERDIINDVIQLFLTDLYNCFGISEAPSLSFELAQQFEEIDKLVD